MTRSSTAQQRRLRLIQGSRPEMVAPESALTADEAREPEPQADDPDAGPESGTADVSEILADGRRPRRATLNQLPDEALVALSVRGEPIAAECLYRRHAGFAFNLAARIAGSTDEVEDVVHDAFLRAFDNLSSIRNPKAFRSWLGSIVVHSMRSRLRRVRLMRFLGLCRGSDEIDLDCIASDEAPPTTRAQLAQVYALLRTLPTDDRIAWTLRHVEGHDLKTAAVLGGCSLATIKRRIRRAQNFIEAHFVDSKPRETSP